MRDQEGAALAAALVVLAVVAALASGLAAATVAGVRGAAYAGDGVRARAAAEAGVEAVLARVCPRGMLPGNRTQLTGPESGGSTVQLDPQGRKVRSTARVGRAEQVLEVGYAWWPPAPVARAAFVGGDWSVDRPAEVYGAVYVGGTLTLRADLTVVPAPAPFGEGSEAKVEAGGVSYAGGRLQAPRVVAPRDRTLGRPPRYREWFRDCADHRVAGLTPVDRGLQVLALMASSGGVPRLIYVDGDLAFYNDPLVNQVVSYTGTATVYVAGRVCAPMGLQAAQDDRLWIIAERGFWGLAGGRLYQAFVESLGDVRLVDLTGLLGLGFCGNLLGLTQVPVPSEVVGGVAAAGDLASTGPLRVVADARYQRDPPPGAGVPQVSEWRVQP